jgi:tripartite-type tricarboxylate transporter receptor subunit TctC
MLLVTHPSLPVTTFQGFIHYARQNPGKINVSSAGNGTLPHITMELLSLKEKIQVTNVPYRGAMPALADLVAGQVQAKLDNYTQSAQYIADRKLNLLAVTSAQRLKQFPDVPTVAEIGLPQAQFDFWIGMLAPAQTPRPIVNRLNAELAALIQTPEMRERLASLGAEPMPMSPERFDAYMRQQLSNLVPLMRAAGVKAN